MELSTELVAIGSAAVLGLVAYAAHRRASAKRKAKARAMTDAALSEQIFWLNSNEVWTSEFHREAEARKEKQAA